MHDGKSKLQADDANRSCALKKLAERSDLTSLCGQQSSQVLSYKDTFSDNGREQTRQKDGRTEVHRWRYACVVNNSHRMTHQSHEKRDEDTTHREIIDCSRKWVMG